MRQSFGDVDGDGLGGHRALPGQGLCEPVRVFDRDVIIVLPAFEQDRRPMGEVLGVGDALRVPSGAGLGGFASLMSFDERVDKGGTSGLSSPPGNRMPTRRVSMTRPSPICGRSGRQVGASSP